MLLSVSSYSGIGSFRLAPQALSRRRDFSRVRDGRFLASNADHREKVSVLLAPEDGSWGVEKAVWFAWLAFLAVCGILTFSHNNVAIGNTSHSLQVSIIYQVHNLQLILLDSAGKVY